MITSIRQVKIESSRGVFLIAEKEGGLVGHAFLEIPEAPSLCHVAQLNIVVYKGYQGKGVGTQLMEKIIEWAKESKTVEKIEGNVPAGNTRAMALYTKMGFFEEGCLKKRVKIEDRYIDEVVMALHIKGDLPHRNISRVGVYGVVRDGYKMLLVTQGTGTYVDRLDLPGGGIEFGETVEETLHREFLEEVGMDFESMELATNLTVQVERPTYTFHQIGLIYSVFGLKEIKNPQGSLKHAWVDLRGLSEEKVSPFVWQLIKEEA